MADSDVCSLSPLFSNRSFTLLSTWETGWPVFGGVTPWQPFGSPLPLTRPTLLERPPAPPWPPRVAVLPTGRRSRCSVSAVKRGERGERSELSPPKSGRGEVTVCGGGGGKRSSKQEFLLVSMVRGEEGEESHLACLLEFHVCWSEIPLHRALQRTPENLVKLRRRIDQVLIYGPHPIFQA